jgi:pimeloyl-ACP methyl ester carboxylesterase
VARQLSQAWRAALAAGLVMAIAQAEGDPILVFVPTLEASALIDQAPIEDGGAEFSVWGSTAKPEHYYALRLPNQLEVRPLPRLGNTDLSEGFLQAVTTLDPARPAFRPFQLGSNFFIFSYDWRRHLGDEIAPALADALVQYARIRSEATGQPIENVRFVIVAHGAGGLVARTLLSQRPRLASHILRLYLVATPNLGTVSTLAPLLSGAVEGREKEKSRPATHGFLLASPAWGRVPMAEAKLIAVTLPSLYQLLPLRETSWLRYYPDDSPSRVSEDDLLTVGTWKDYWPSAEKEKSLFIEPHLSKLAGSGEDPTKWQYLQDMEFLKLQQILARTREWRLQLGKLSYTDQLLTRPGEKSRLRLVVGRGVRTPSGIISEGTGERTVTRFTHDPEITGDGIVTTVSAIEDLHNEDQVAFIDGVPHYAIPSHEAFLRVLLTELTPLTSKPAVKPAKPRSRLPATVP